MSRGSWPAATADAPGALGGPGNLFAPVIGLAGLATELAELPIGPSAAFRDRLRVELLQEAGRRAAGADAVCPGTAGVALGRPPRPRVPSRRRLGRRLAAAGVATALAAGGVSAAAAGAALPGDPLYPLKRFGESIRASLDPGSGASAALGRLSSRLQEVERIATLDPHGAEPARWDRADAALRYAESALSTAIALEPADDLRPDLATAGERLQRLLPRVPAAHRAGVQTLLDVISGLPDTSSLGADTPALPYGLLPLERLDLDRTLGQGWPLDPASVLPPVSAAGARLPSATMPVAGGPGGTSTGTGSSKARTTSMRMPPAPLQDGIASGTSRAAGSPRAATGAVATGSGSAARAGGVPAAGAAVRGRTATGRASTAGTLVTGAGTSAASAVSSAGSGPDAATDTVNRLPRILSPGLVGGSASRFPGSHR